jgi:hypothetical protein
LAVAIGVPGHIQLRAAARIGRVDHDCHGFVGTEDLDVAFRLLDAPRLKTCLKTAPGPLALVVSDNIYRSVVRSGYDGVSSEDFLPLVTVNVSGQRRKGWVQLPRAEKITIARQQRESR